MTDRELMQQALDAMEVLWDLLHDIDFDTLRERLAQPKQPQWHMAGFSTPTRPATREEKIVNPGVYEVPITPPRREWVGLTATEQMQVAIVCGCADVAWIDFACAIEAKLKEKNS